MVGFSGAPCYAECMTNHAPHIYPSLMAAPALNVQHAMDALEPYVQGWHLDIMDGHFVPNLTYGPAWIEAVVQNTKRVVDVHLMVDPVEPWLDWLPHGITSVTFHPESTKHAYRVLQALRARGIKAGVALSPGTGLHLLDALAPVLDIVLILCVNPGWCGQKFLPDMVDKLRSVQAWRGERPIAIHVDGGIGPTTAPLCLNADVLIAGSAVFDGADMVQNFHNLHTCLDGA